jgi:hypothetical protein
VHSYCIGESPCIVPNHKKTHCSYHRASPTLRLGSIFTVFVHFRSLIENCVLLYLCVYGFIYDTFMLYYLISNISLYISLLYLRSHFMPKIIRINGISSWVSSLSLLKKISLARPKKTSMEEENKNDRLYDSIILFLEKSLTQQRDEMMENFSHILRCLSITTGAYSSSDHFGGTSPFNVQVNFYIPIFEGHIDADSLRKWLNILEGYFFVHNFFDKERITFALLKALPHVKNWWETYSEKSSTKESGIYGVEPTWDFFANVVKEQY